MNAPLPRGIYYEHARQRYRVRLYKRGQPVYLSYHPTLEQAIDALSAAREAVDKMVFIEGPADLTEPSSQIQALQELYR